MTIAHNDVAILAGGMGTRLRSRTGNLPKPMAPVLGKPVLEHLIDMCVRAGFPRIALLVHHEHQMIERHFGNGASLGAELTYCVEIEARGTAGALHDALPFLAPQFLVLYGDTFCDVDLNAMMGWHQRTKASATLFLHPNDHPSDSDLVAVDEKQRVTAVYPYPRLGRLPSRNLVNAALYVFEKDIISNYLPPQGKADIAKNTLPKMLDSGVSVSGYVSPEYVKDMGTPERLDKVEFQVDLGVADRLSSRQPRQAVFVDRDGTLNVERGLISRPENLELIEGAARAISRLNKAGWLTVAVTNQPVVARGDVSWSALEKIHIKLDELLGDDAAYLDKLYYCPHHPDSGFPGEIRALKFCCECRKPDTGMIDSAVKDLNISRQDSWIVGDSTSDILAGQRAGLRTILVETGHGGKDRKYSVEPHYISDDIASAVDWILVGHASNVRQLTPIVAKLASARLILIDGRRRAGKSSTARVLAELLALAGRTVHVIGADGRLPLVSPNGLTRSPAAVRELDAMRVELVPIVSAPTRIHVSLRGYGRHFGAPSIPIETSIGRDDIIIVEGTAATQIPQLQELDAIVINITCEEPIRQARIERYARQTGLNIKEVDRVTATTPIESRYHRHQLVTSAGHIIDGGAIG